MRSPASQAVDGGRLAVLLATHNGAAFLDQQLRSVAEQNWALIDVWASDDCSTDGTRAILDRWAKNWSRGRFEILCGPGAGFAGNFRSLLTSAGVDADYVAFCDQDDIWLPDKTREAVTALSSARDGPGLYCARTIIADASGSEIAQSPRFNRPADFRNALVQNIGGGNTMVMNRAAFDLVRTAAEKTDFVSHDWFAYLIVSGNGGLVSYSLVPHVLYRQHGRNAVGSNRGTGARWERLRLLLMGRLVDWNEHNLRALAACRSHLEPRALEVIRLFELARTGPLLPRLANLKRSGAYRQTLAGQVSLYLACALRKL